MTKLATHTSNLDSVFESLQLLQRLLVHRNELLCLVPSRLRWENILEHVHSSEVGRVLLSLTDAFADFGVVDEYLSQPETALRACSENWIHLLGRLLLDLEDPLLFLFQSIQQGHRLVSLSQVLQLILLNDALVIDGCILLCFERLNLKLSILQGELLPCLIVDQRVDVVQ